MGLPPLSNAAVVLGLLQMNHLNVHLRIGSWSELSLAAPSPFACKTFRSPRMSDIVSTGFLFFLVVVCNAYHSMFFTTDGVRGLAKEKSISHVLRSGYNVAKYRDNLIVILSNESTVYRCLNTSWRGRQVYGSDCNYDQNKLSHLERIGAQN